MNKTTESLSTQAQEHIGMLEAEMESLRRRMKLLETRVAEFDNKPLSTPSFGQLGKERAATTGLQNQAQRPTSAAAGISSPAQTPSTPPSDAHSPVSKRRRSSRPRKTSHSQSQRSANPRRRSRSSKLKRQLLFGYGILIGGTLVAVLVLMIMNLFRSEHITADGLRYGFGGSGSDSPELNIENDSRPDLE